MQVLQEAAQLLRVGFSKCLWLPKHSIGHKVPKAPGKKHGTHPLGHSWCHSAAVWCCSAMLQRALYAKHAGLTAIVNTLQSQQNTAILSCAETACVYDGGDSTLGKGEVTDTQWTHSLLDLCPSFKASNTLLVGIFQI